MDINDIISTYKPIEDTDYVYRNNDLSDSLLGITKSDDVTPDYKFKNVFNLSPYVKSSSSTPVTTQITTQSSSSDLSKSPIEILQEEGINFRLTSGYRPGAVTSSGHASNHSKKDSNGNSLAYDIVPTKGRTFADLKNEIYSNPRLVNYFKNKNIGILEETSKTVMSKTHATGPHFHIGPDTWAVRMFNNNLRTRMAQNGMKFDVSIYEPIKDTNTTPTTIEDLIDQYDQNNSKFSDDFNLNTVKEEKDTQTSLEPTIYTTDMAENNNNNNLDIYHHFGQTKDKEKEFVNVMKPIYLKALEDNGFPTYNINNIIKQAALESGYGLSPRGNGFNLGGIKGSGTKYKDGNSYKDFSNLYDFANYQVKLLNNKYDALTAENASDYVDRLHGKNKDHASYSASPQGYRSAFSRMIQLDKYLS